MASIPFIVFSNCLILFQRVPIYKDDFVIGILDLETFR